jgi:hypothetical protein
LSSLPFIGIGSGKELLARPFRDLGHDDIVSPPGR